MNPLVFVELDDGHPTPGSLGLLAKAHELSPEPSALLCGTGVASVASTLAEHGANEIWLADDPAFESGLAGPFIDTLTTLITDQGIGAILLENSVLAADVAAGVAARLDAGVNWDLQDVTVAEEAIVGRRLALNDSVALDVGWVGAPRFAVFRVGLFEPVERPVETRVRTLAPRFETHSLAARVVDRIASGEAEGPRLTAADVIVAAGRGIGARESLGLIDDLAAAFGGAVAVSLPLVDRGWAPHSRQVGQTGQKVRPKLYLACGVSGALAHRVGMEKSEVIVAINSDPAAPIFGICDAGVVGDLHEVVPALAQLVREGRAST